MVKITFKAKLTKGKIEDWISKTKDIHALQSIRAKTNKRIKSIGSPKEESPFKNIPLEDKKKVLSDLIV